MFAPTAAPAPRTPGRLHRARRALGLSLALALLSTGCATVQTELTVEQDGSGHRDMAAIVTDSSLENAELTPAELEASVKKHLPEQLKYKGMSSRSENGDKVTVLEFSLPYSDVKDYETKVDALLEESKSQVVPTITQERTDSPLVKGVQVKENFSSADLLRWVEVGLHEDKALKEETSVEVDPGNQQDVVVFGDEKFQAGTSQLQVDKTEDNGFSSMTLALTPTADPDRYSGELQLARWGEASRDARDSVEAYFKDHLPEGARLEPMGGAEGAGPKGSRVVLGEGTLEDFAGRLKTVTGQDDISLQSSTRPSADRPLVTEKVLTYRLDAPDLLSPKAEDSAVSVKVEGQGENSSPASASGTQGEVISQQSATLTSVESVVHMDSDDEVTVDTRYSLPKAEGEALRGGVEDALRPQEGIGEIEVQERDDTLDFIVSMKGSPADVSRRLQEYTGDSTAHVAVMEMEGGLRPVHRVSANVPAASSRLKATPETPETVSIEPPSAASVEASTVYAGRLADGAVHATENQPTTVAFDMRTTSAMLWVLIGAAILAVLALLGMGLWLWRRASRSRAETTPAVPAQPEAHGSSAQWPSTRD